jgi:hypothetical protein
MPGSTPVYGIKYILQGEPIKATRQALEDNANTIEAALMAGGVAAPGASDLLAVSGRVAALEGISGTEAAIKVQTSGRKLSDLAHATDTGAIGVWDGGRWLFYDTRWQIFTPVLASGGAAPGTTWGTVGNAVIVARYFRKGREVTYKGFVQIGTTTAYAPAGGAPLMIGYPPGYVPVQWSTAFSEVQGQGLIQNGAYAILLAGLAPSATPANRRLNLWAANNPVTTVGTAPGTYGITAANHMFGWSVTYETNFEA